MPQCCIKQIMLSQLDNFSYIISDRDTKEAYVVDPSVPAAVILTALKKEGVTLKGVLLTHGHFDHTVDSNTYDVPVHLSMAEAVYYTPAARNLVRIADNAKLGLGGLEVVCLHVPGHTPGCQCFYVDGNLFTGDVLFIDAVGRTDLPGGSADILFNSLQRLKQLPDATVVWPGHHYGAVAHATLGELKNTNPFLACASLVEFRQYLG